MTEVQVVGIAGGIASGKSTVCRLLAERDGVESLDADRIAHRALEREEVADAIVERFGSEVRNADGAIDREALGRIVFDDPERLQALEGIVHPHVFQTIRERIQSGDAAIWLIDAPLLFETGLERLCDATIFVDAPIEVREARVQRERDWARGELARREAHQFPPAEKRIRATWTLENKGTKEELEAAVDRLWEDWLGPSSP